MTDQEYLNLAKVAIRKRIGFEDFYYSDYMYGNEKETESVWKYVNECEEIGTVAFQNKYGSL